MRYGVVAQVMTLTLLVPRPAATLCQGARFPTIAACFRLRRWPRKGSVKPLTPRQKVGKPSRYGWGLGTAQLRQVEGGAMEGGVGVPDPALRRAVGWRDR
jgi:hypothetical protein